jgi:GT2 family glycosyltransferase
MSPPDPEDDVVLVVVTHNSADVLPAFAEALPAAVDGVDRWRLVVADNASSDGTVELARRLLPDALIVETGDNFGYSAGINAGLRAASPSAEGVAVVLNPDIRLGAGSVAALREGLTRPRTGIVVPRLLDQHGTALLSLRRAPSVRTALGESLLGGGALPRRLGLTEMIDGPDAYADGAVADWATGGALMISAACLAATGAWDESFFLYEEEVEYCLRAADRGFVLRYVPAATATRVLVDHDSKPDIRTLMKVNKARLYRSRHGPMRGGVFRGALLAGEIARGVIGRKASRAAARGLVRDRHPFDHVMSRRPAVARGDPAP